MHQDSPPGGNQRSHDELERGVKEILLFGGGTIPGKDRAALEALGVGRMFTAGADTREIVPYLRETLLQGQPQEEGVI